MRPATSLLLSLCVPASPAAAEGFSDDFASPVPGAWTAASGVDWRTADGVLESPLSGGLAGMLRAPTMASDVVAQVDLRLPEEGRCNPGLLFRLREDGTGYVVRWYDRMEWLELLRYERGDVVRVEGNHWQASSPARSVPQRRGLWYSFRVEAVGRRVRAKVWPRGEAEPPWQLQAACPDLAPGAVGLSVDETQAHFDNFVARSGRDIADLVWAEERAEAMQRHRRRSTVIQPAVGLGLGLVRARFTLSPGIKDPTAEVLFRARDANNLYVLRATRGSLLLGKMIDGHETAIATRPAGWFAGPGNYVAEVEVLVADRDGRGPVWFLDADQVPPMVRLRARVWPAEALGPPRWPPSVVDDPIIPGRRGEPYWTPDPFADSSARAPLGQGVGWREAPGVTWLRLELSPRALPSPKVLAVAPYRHIVTGDRGGCWLALGDLTGDGRLDFVVARNDNQAVTALTAYANDGRELWRWGEGGRADISYDVPATCYDLDGDGRAEVLCSIKGFLLVIDGRTGRENARYPLPQGLDVADCIAVANLRGLPRPQDLLLKTRYDRLWALTADFEPLWEFAGNTGHHPAVRDVDGDGRDEVLCGYTLLDHDGTPLWQADLPDHADTTRLVEMAPGGPVRALIACGGGNDMALLSLDGTILWRQQGLIPDFHFQSAQVGELRPDSPGYEIICDDGWARPGRGQLALFAADGRWLGAFYSRYQRFARLIDWEGDGRARIVLPADHAICDGRGHRVAVLTDGPELGGPGAESPMVRTADLDGDGRDELILYNAEGLFLYRNPRPPAAALAPQPMVQERYHNFTYY